MNTNQLWPHHFCPYSRQHRHIVVPSWRKILPCRDPNNFSVGYFFIFRNNVKSFLQVNCSSLHPVRVAVTSYWLSLEHLRNTKLVSILTFRQDDPSYFNFWTILLSVKLTILKRVTVLSHWRPSTHWCRLPSRPRRLWSQRVWSFPSRPAWWSPTQRWRSRRQSGCGRTCHRI